MFGKEVISYNHIEQNELFNRSHSFVHKQTAWERKSVIFKTRGSLDQVDFSHTQTLKVAIKFQMFHKQSEWQYNSQYGRDFITRAGLVYSSGLLWWGNFYSCILHDPGHPEPQFSFRDWKWCACFLHLHWLTNYSHCLTNPCQYNSTPSTSHISTNP